MSSHSFMQIDFDKNLRAASNALKMWDSRALLKAPKAYTDPRSDEGERDEAMTIKQYESSQIVKNLFTNIASKANAMLHVAMPRIPSHLGWGGGQRYITSIHRPHFKLATASKHVQIWSGVRGKEIGRWKSC
jgi:hypothetical protein